MKNNLPPGYFKHYNNEIPPHKMRELMVGKPMFAKFVSLESESKSNLHRTCKHCIYNTESGTCDKMYSKDIRCGNGHYGFYEWEK